MTEGTPIAYRASAGYIGGMAFVRRIGLLICLWGLVLGCSWGQGVLSASASDANSDILEFLSGDILRGRLLGMDTNGLRWQHGTNQPVLTVKPEGVYKVRLSKTHAVPAHRSDTIVRLLNGDELRGELREMDDRLLVLQTWYAGELHILRQGLASLQTGLSRYQVFYEGPEGMAGWTNQSGVRTDNQVIIINGIIQTPPASLPPNTMANGWHYYNGAFYGVNSGFLGRAMNLPPVSSIEFDVSWQGNLGLGIWFYTDRLGSPDGNGYFLQLSPRTLQLYRATRTGQNMTLGSVELPEVGRSFRVAIRTDIPNKTLALYVNDVLLRQWLDISNLEGLGNGLGFHLGGMSQKVRLANLRVTSWDGQIDRMGEFPVSPGQEVVRLQNKDRITGKVKNIRNGELVVQAPFGDLPLPLERVAGIDFVTGTSTNTNVTNPDAQIIRAFLHGGGRLTMRLENWNDRQITATGPFFERATFHPALFQSMQFNLSKPRLDLDFFDAPSRFVIAPEILLDGF